MDIWLQDVSKSFDDVSALQGFELHVRSGELLGLLGPSGCGKTTALFSICGLHKIDAGQILFGERDVTHLPPQARNVGLVFQSYALYPHLTSYENIAFPLRVRRMKKRVVDERVCRIAEILQIETLLERRPEQLSGGQQQRVAVARALVRDPDVLLMDEPLANLDARLRLEMRSELRRIQRDTGTTTILVTHDQSEAMSLCDRIALMNGGRLEQVGSPEEIYRQPANQFVAGFVGTPTIVFCEGRAKSGRFVSGSLDLPVSGDIKARIHDGAKIIAGIRAEIVQPHLSVPVQGTIVFVEPVGRESHYGILLGDGTTLRSVQTGAPRFRSGESISWGLDPEGLLFFAEDGTRL